MNVFYSQDAEIDLEDIASYIAADDPRGAVNFIAKINEEIECIGKGPLLYQLRPDIGTDARLAVVKSYVILFRCTQDAVYIERIVYGGRDLPSLYQ